MDQTKMRTRGGRGLKIPKILRMVAEMESWLLQPRLNSLLNRHSESSSAASTVSSEDSSSNSEEASRGGGGKRAAAAEVRRSYCI